MPIYEYECKECGEITEILQKVSDAPTLLCPNCATESLERIVSRTGFRLNGTGWYETDFKSGDKRNLKHDDSKENKSSDVKASSKSDATKSVDKAASSGKTAGEGKSKN